MLMAAAVWSGCAAGVTRDPFAVTGTVAFLDGQVITNTGGEVEYWVEYGPSVAYGAETEHQSTTAEVNQPQSVFFLVTGLDRSTTHHYRVCASDSQQQGGPRCGEDRQFTTRNVDCGDTITADLRLSGDLDCDASQQSDGLFVGAAGIDINLAGHTVVGGVGAAVDNTAGYDDVTIRNGRVRSFGDSINLVGASRNRIHGVTAGAIGRDFESSTGIRIDGGADNVIQAGGMFGRNTGLSVTGSPRVLVDGSRATSKFGPAISIASDATRVRDNHLTSVIGEGVQVRGSGNRIRRNVTDGVSVGIIIGSGDDNVVAENQVTNSSSAFASADGILVDALAVGTLLRANTATANQGNGIKVDSPSTRLRDNVANDNGLFGIDAVAGVTDLGGNTASGNGNPLQCRNVFCQ
jgi:hypothetical protein